MAKDGFEWYVVFISIVFGVFISVWVEPMAGKSVADFMEQGFSPKNAMLMARGLLMFCILVCLWWWYAMFLGKLAPADGFLMFFYDFMSLASFAVAFRVWDIPLLFSITVFLGATFMLIRFALAYKGVGQNTKEEAAMKVAMFTLLLYMAYFSAFITMFVFGRIEKEFIDYGVMALLIAGIVATVYAVKKAEGLKWGKPMPLGVVGTVEEAQTAIEASGDPLSAGR